MEQQGRVRRVSMELNPASAAFLQQEGINGINYSSSSYKQDPLSLLLGQDVAAAATGLGRNGMNGLLSMEGPPAMTGGMVEQPQYTEPLCMPGTSCYSSMPMDAEEPGPLPCLPRAGRMAGGYGSNAALIMQQQQLQHLQRCGYPNTGAPGPGGRPLRPRRHSVTIGMLNEHQQQQALLAAGGQLPAGWSAGVGGAAAAAGRAGPSRMQMLPQQSSPNKQLQGLNMQAAAAAAQLGISQPALGQSFMAGASGAGAGIQQLQQLSGTPIPPAVGLAGAVGMGSMGPGGLLGLEMTPGYGLDGPRMPGAGGSRRHSWAPMGADASMAYARTWLLQQQQQRGLTAQLGDAGALFVNQQQQDQLGLGRLGPPLGQHNGLDNGAAGLNGRAAALMGDSAGSGLQSQGSLSFSGSMYGAEALAKDQLAQHLQQQLQQLQLQDLASRIGGAGQGLDPYAEPFVSQAASLMQPGGGLAGLPSIDPYTTVLQQELKQHQQSALALQLVEDAALSPAAAAAAASMYAPLQVNGVSVDTQSLVSPYVDNWDVLAQGSAHSSLAGSNLAVPSSNGVSALAGLGATPMSHIGLPVKAAKGVPLGGLCGGCAGHGSSRAHHGHSLGSNSSSSSTSTGSGNGSKGSSTAPLAAAAAAVTMLASLPPLTKVCSEVPWNLKKAADEDAQVMTAQQDQVKKLAAALERSRTLQQVHAAEDAVAEASAAASAARSTGQQLSAGAADGAAALFAYKLPDSGDDTWGGSSGGADTATVPGGSCISQEPSNKLFVGNIGWWVTEEDLLHWFGRFGNVINVKIMYNSRKMHKPKDKWRSREYGFIDYASPEEAAKAIVWMDGVELPDLMKDTCGIIVQYAKPTGSNEASVSAA